MIEQGGPFAGGRYRIDSVLGKGGFAVVYRATDLQSNVPVAIKVLEPDGEGYSSTRAARFEREIGALMQLRDPHTVELLAHGTSEDGLLYLVFELVGGQDLSALLAIEGRLSDDIVRHILIQVLESLREAHGLGILHRDIKPSNIRVFETADDPYRVKLLDFGVAKPLATEAIPVTQSGDVVGTVRYVSPEQLFGGELSPASDLYSLGLVAFEALTGRPSEHLRVIAEGGTLEITAQDGVDLDIAAVINRLLALKVTDRYQSATQVLADLRRGVSRPLRRARAQASSQHSETLVGARRKSWSPALTILAGLVVGVGLALLVAPMLRREPTARPVRSLRIPQPAEPIASGPRPAPGDAGHAATDTRTETSAPAAAGCGAAAPFHGSGTLAALHGLSSLQWSAYIPSSYDRDEPQPLLILFHEAGESAANFMHYTGLPRLADQKDFVIIAPEDDFLTPWEGSLDAPLFALESTQKTLCIDPARIFAAGHGSGGIAVERLPCEHPVTAIATTGHRNWPGHPACRAEKPVPFIHLAALHDGYNPVDGGVGCSGATKISLAEKEQLWRGHNGCSGPRSTYSKYKSSRCFTWQCDAAFVSCHVDGGRNWPGVEDRVWDVKNCDGQPADFPYADTIWAFFEKAAADSR